MSGSSQTRVSSLFDLSGRVALVTGGSSGIGKAIALGLSAHGAKVALFSRTASDLEQTAREIADNGGEALVLPGDVTVEADVNGAVQATVDRWGTLDVLVNDAGRPFGRAAERTSMEDIRAVYDVHVFGMFSFARAAFGPMSRQGRGSIINLTSVGAVTVPRSHSSQTAYASAKAAVIMMTKNLAVEWAKHGIRVNAIGPGYTLSPTFSGFKEKNPAIFDEWMTAIPMRRAAQPEEMQGAAIYLASDASSYVTGAVIWVDGGFTCA